MNTVVKIEPKDVDAIPFQEASLDIWDKKYRLTAKDGSPIDKTMDDTYKRVARALADVEREEVRDHWYERFLWALRRGAIPAGRVTSNAGAWEHKPATSTINCTVSGTIRDSMDDILRKVHEAGLTLKAGCGIGYEHSTLRPRGAYVSGAGAYTSGPLSFMDIYDKMCFTVSSAGGRRGAQMGTFDVGHPDAMEFIRAKRENGRLRQFNLSLLITDEFMAAVRGNKEWKLAFPITSAEMEGERPDLADSSKFVWREWPVHDGYVVNEEGLVACKVYKTLPARRMWDVIMTSTYDFAEPGFILIDRVNEMNNNWWCENIRATNPCVTADTRLATQFGLVRIGDLYDARVDIQATVDGRTLAEGKGATVRPAVPAFMSSPSADVYRVVTEAGYEVKATKWHDFYTSRGKIKLKDLRPGDELFIQSGKGQFGGCGNEELGVLLGVITGDGHFTNRGKGQQAAVVNLWGADREYADVLVSYVNSMIDGWSAGPRNYRVSAVAVPARNLIMIRSVVLMRYLKEFFGVGAACKTSVPEIVWRGNEACVKGYLRGLFQSDGTVQRDDKNACCTIRLASSEPSLLKDVQVLLTNFGIFCRVLKRREAGQRSLPDGRGGKRLYACKADYELIIGSSSRDRFMEEIGFLTDEKNEKYCEWREAHDSVRSENFVSSVASIEFVGREAVFDTTQPDRHSLIFNGVVTGNCGEQPLTAVWFVFVRIGQPDTLCACSRSPIRAKFDWNEYREVVKVFTRMLDNVVEINGLPLEKQRDEIMRKRRHGMGFLGLGSTMTLLRMKYGSPEAVQLHRGGVARDGARRLGGGARAGAREGAGADHERGVHGHQGDAAQASRDGARRLEAGREDRRAAAAREVQPLHAARRGGRTAAGRTSSPRPGRASRITPRSRPRARSRCRSPTMRRTASSLRSRTHYFRNVIRAGKKSKEKIDVYSFELLAYRELVNPKAKPGLD